MIKSPGRRSFIGGLVAALLASPGRSQERLRRVGVLANGPPTTPETARIYAAFVDTLKEHGYVEGRNLVIERRYLEGRLERAPALIAELVRIPVDVIVTGNGPSVKAAMQASSTIPIVMSDVSDPVGAGLVASLARPGGNVTGMADLQIDLIPKRLQLLKEIAPRIARVAFVRGNYSGFGKERADTEIKRRADAADVIGVRLIEVRMDTPQDFERAKAEIVAARVDALLVSPNPTNFILRRELAAFALAQRLPAIGARREEAMGGLLLSYGPDVALFFRGAATYVAKILNGAKPADLPIQQPTKIDLVVNAATAKALGLRIPASLRVDETV